MTGVIRNTKEHNSMQLSSSLILLLLCGAQRKMCPHKGYVRSENPLARQTVSPVYVHVRDHGHALSSRITSLYMRRCTESIIAKLRGFDDTVSHMAWTDGPRFDKVRGVFWKHRALFLYSPRSSVLPIARPIISVTSFELTRYNLSGNH